MNHIAFSLLISLPLANPRMPAPHPPSSPTDPVLLRVGHEKVHEVPATTTVPVPAPVHTLSIDPVWGNLSDAGPKDDVIEKLLQGANSNFTKDYRDWFKTYHPLAAHTLYLQRLHGAHRSRSALFTPGQSFERRNIEGIHLWGGREGSGPGRPGANPAVVLHGTAHAREWATTPVVEYIAQRLLARYGRDADATAALDRYDFYAVPVVNPDGFAFSHGRAGGLHDVRRRRGWRKNRQVRGGGGGGGSGECTGTDLNRNWPVTVRQWQRSGAAGDRAGGADRDKSASDRPCSETFRGFRAGDTPEVAALAEHMLNVSRAQSIRLFIDFHAFGQLIMYPYGYSCHVRLPPDSRIIRVAQAAARAMKQVHGTSYQTGTACDLLYPTSGSSEDFAFSIAGAAYAYTIELRPSGRGGGKGDFELPEDQIEPTAEEAFAGVMAMLRLIHQGELDDERV